MSEVEFSINDLSPEELQALLEHLENSDVEIGESSAQKTCPIEVSDPDRTEFPLSLAQQRLWFLSQMDTGATAAYIIASDLLLDGKLDREALKAALDTIVERHHILHSHFENHEGEAVQIVDKSQGFMLHERDVNAPAIDWPPKFDLTAGHLIQGELIHESETCHRLRLAMHHIIADGWSLSILFTELSQLYEAYQAEQSNPLSPLTLQYGDYACWQREYVSGEVLKTQQAYWEAQLSGAPDELLLPKDRERPTVQDYRGGMVDVVLDRALTGELKALSQQHGCTLYMTLLASWAVLMGRLAGQDDVVIGSPVAGRTRSEVEGLIGMFVNTQALRVDLSGEPDMRELLSRVKQISMDAQEHQDIPFEQVVEAVSPTRSLSYSPLSQVMFALQNGSSGHLKLGDIELSAGQPEMETAQFDLSLLLSEAEGELRGGLNYAVSLFDEGTVQRYVDYWKRLLKGLVNTPEKPVASHPLLGEVERYQVLHDFNQTERYYLDSPCIHALFEAQALAHGDAIAVEDEAGVLSYGELNAQANQLARYLRDKGIGRGDLVAVSLERGRGMVTALLAVLKAGGAYVPMDPGYPQERLSYMLSDSQPKVLLTDSALSARFDMLPQGTRVLALDTESGWQAMAGTNLSEAGVQADDLAYVIYTSGSTGQPKGVMNGHRGVVNRLRWMIEDYGFSASDVVLQKTSFSFDVSVWEFFATLGSGARLVMAKPEGHKDPDYLREVIERTGVTLMHFVPPMLQSFLFGQKAGRCASLRGIFCSGDALSDETVRQSQRRLPGVPVHNLYGPTEAAVDVTAWTCPEPLNERVRIGYPVANTRMYLLDPYGEPVGVGVTGELYIGGEQVAQGYLNRPDLTAERFMADPFVQQSGARMYRTGDLGRWLADGSIEYLGRNDQQVKIRGFRIELGEIESALKALEGVADAVVLARRDNGEVPQLVGYYCGDARVESLRHALSAALPDYMVPAAYVQLEAIPLTANGKVDRKGLPEPGEDAFVHAAYEAPQGEAEQILAAIWRELLQVEQVGRNDDFFGLGGHSLMAVQLASRIRSELGRDVSLADLFAHPQLKAQALIVTLREADELPAIEAQGVGEGVAQPLSMAQQRLWFLSQMDPDASAAYVIAFDLVLDGRLNRPALKAALDEIVTRHHVLRSHFASDGSGAVQIVDAATGFSLHSRRSDEAGVQWPPVFDLSRGPLFCGELIEEQAQRHRLRLAMHHIISDGWSQGVLFNELGQLYQAYCDGDASPLAPLALQYGDYAHWQRCYLSGDVLKGQQTYWEAQLRGTPDELLLPKDRARPAVQDYRGGMVDVVLEGALTGELKALSQRHGCTLYMTLLASWSVLMGQLSGQDDVVIGSPVAGRSRTEVEGLIGMFVNTQALRIDLSGEPDMGTLLSRVKQVSVDAQMHAEIPFEQVVEAVSPSRSLSHSPLFQVMLTLQNLPEQRVLLGDLALQAGESTIETAQFDLSLVVSEVDGELRGGLNYAVSLFDEETVQRYVDYWVQLLHGLVSAPAQPVAAHPLLGEVERHQVLHDFNQTDRAYPTHTCMHELFEAQAEANGDAIAVEDEDGALSYAELNAQVNQLARYLRHCGVIQGARVAISLERSRYLVMALMATLKAGGAYVPMDPGYPQERLSYMLEDSQPKVLLTDSHLASRFDALLNETRVLTLDTESGWQAMATTNLSEAGVQADDIAYVIYTSGSTGQPKGVMNAHRGVVNRLRWMMDDYQFSASDVVLQKTPFSFDVSVWEFFVTLGSGARLVMAKPEGHKDPDYLREVIERYGVTLVHFVPPMLQSFLFGQKAGQCPSLRGIFCSGDALSDETVRQSQSRLPGVPVHNLYGPTEAAVEVTAWTCPEPLDERVKIGYPVANTRMYLLDPYGEPVGVGVTGELYIGGAQVALGYLNRPELTAERFMADPFSDEPGERMYRTGDLGRWHSDGSIEYLGRNDQQVKIRGFRIELGEIESALKAQEGVSDAVVLARRDTGDVPQLVGYYCGDASVDSLRQALSADLPDYMVPAAYVVLDDIPLTANGKVDRRALPAPDESAYVHQVYEAPEGDAEQTLAVIWHDLLGIEQIGRHDDFFGLGGHSLMAVQLIERLREHGYQLSVNTLFDDASLKGLASALQLSDLDASDGYQVPANLIPSDCQVLTPTMLPLVELNEAELRSIEAKVSGGSANIQDIYPLAPLQEGILFHHLLSEEGDPYVSRLVLGFTDTENLNAFVNALRSVIARHDILRTAIVWEGLNEPAQVVWRDAPLPLQALSLEGDDVVEQMKARLDPAHLRLNVQQAPMMAAYHSSDPSHGRELLCLLLHHLCNDHTTLELLLEELQAYLVGRSDELPTPLAFRDFVARARHEVDRDAQQAYFREQLGDIDEGCTPFGLTDVQGDGRQIESATEALSDELSRLIREQSRQRGMSSAALFHLAWGLVVRAGTGRDDVVFGTVLFGRMNAGKGADRMLGMFLNTLPLRLTLNDRPLDDVLKETQQRLAGLLNHEHTSLVQAQQCSGVGTGQPLFSSLINYRYQGGSSQIELDEKPSGFGVVFAEERTNYPLMVSVNDHEDGSFSFEVQSDACVGAQRIAAMLIRALDAVMVGLVDSADQSVVSLPVLSESEYHQVVYDFNQTERYYLDSPCIHALFEAQALAHGDAIAVEDEAGVLSYAELNAQANQLARYLRENGIGRGDLVAVSLERGCGMVTALLAVLKAGGAYVPMDPGYPQERLSYMLSDSQPKVLVTDWERAPLFGSRPETTTLVLLEKSEDWSSFSDQNGIEPHAESSDLAYVIYTSGSTGQPKGVLVEHRNLSHLVAWHNRQFNITAGTCASSVAGVGFDAAVWEIWPVLCGGGQLLMPTLEVSRDPQQLLDWWQSQPIEVGFLSTAIAELAFNRGLTHPTLRTLLVGGDRLTQLPKDVTFEVVNNYGPTETTVVATSGVMRAGRDILDIGGPIDNTRVYLLNGAGQPVPVGVAGELYIGGAGVARGYLNRPDLTVERFMADPFSDEPGARMYRTGDLGRWLADGRIEYLGRNDQQVKIRGYRIELGEIESALKVQEGVSDAAVVAWQRDGGAPQLVGYYCGAALPDGLRQGVSAQLPDYMVPAAYVQLDEIPLTANGKVDRKGLPEPGEDAFVHAAYEAPEGKLEVTLAKLWGELLGLEKIGRNDDFFELGGHSLLGVQLVTRIREKLSIEITITDLFKNPKLNALATRLTYLKLSKFNLSDVQALARQILNR
ncbi:MAG: Tyrocidine synthase 3 [Candidatus Celerinatantimonas neptuna]|nr:MAG: Tyrocidine synthase 3 [Candidatus Celerinatantimonas neptuna]